MGWNGLASQEFQLITVQGEPIYRLLFFASESIAVYYVKSGTALG
jgi:hypothetical protein